MNGYALMSQVDPFSNQVNAVNLGRDAPVTTASLLDSSFVYTFIRHNYPLQPVAVHPLGSDPAGDRFLCRVEDSAGRAWVLRLRQWQEPAPAWFGGGRAARWLGERAEVLAWVRGRGYPAPQPLGTSAGTMVSKYRNWCGILTPYYPGSRLDNSSDSFGLLAAALGRLHAATVGPESVEPPLTIASWWHPLDRAARSGLQELPVLSDIAQAWQPLHTCAEQILQKLNRPLSLPVACIHGDCWSGNAIRGPGGVVTLIDWDTAGVGAPLLDFASLLGECTIRQGGAVVPDGARIKVVVDGYRQYRPLTETERALLPEAMQFGPAFRTALRFSRAAREGWREDVERGLAREQARLDAGGRIAWLALAHLGVPRLGIV